MAADPDGHNINAGVGSTHPEHVQAALARTGAPLGLAHDGDADRLLAVDERGGLVDGDVILAITALDARRPGDLPTGTVVTTVMTNLGFRRAMAATASRWTRPASATGTCWRPCSPAATPSAASSPAT